MKKRSAKNGTKFKCLFNKMGMTYIELICALALLSLIVVMFTPMLLSSYETLYIAGEKVEEVYDSKEQMETGLAVRSSTIRKNFELTFGYNSEKLFEKLNVSGRRIVSTVQGGLETVFHGVRARVDILTPKVVYDDTSHHKLIIQTTGLDWQYNDTRKDVIVFNHPDYRTKNLQSLKEGLQLKQILVEVIKPDKSQSASSGSTLDENVYKLGDRPELKPLDDKGTLVKIEPEKKRITFNISGVDFTTSPLKICVYYVNERGTLKTLTDYMYIKPAHIIFAGEGGPDYFTSAGIERVDISTGVTESTQYVLNIEGRGMDVSNSPLLQNATPRATGAVINAIEWIDTDENSGLDPYYVMAGTNGSVYRMYNMNTMNNLGQVLGTGTNINATTDNSYNIDTGEKIFPNFWSGEISDQYSFQTMYHAATYGAAKDNDIDCSAPNDSDTALGDDHTIGLIGTQYNKFDTRLRYSMVFNAYRMGYSYASQMSRKISYVLTEAGKNSFRIGGKKRDEPDFIGYHIPWEATSAESSDKQDHYTTFEGGLFSANTDTELTVYLGGFGAGAATNAHTDMHLAYLRLSSYTSINPLEAVNDTKKYQTTNGDDATMYDRLITGGEFWSPPDKSEEDLKGMGWKDRVNYISTDYACKTNISSISYLPGSSSSGKGQVIYFGSVPAYALMRQSSDFLNGQENVYNTDTARAKNSSAATVYLLCGSQGAGTTIYRNAYNYYTQKEWNGAIRETNYYSQGGDVQNKIRTQINDNSYTTKTDANEFYTLGNDTQTYKIFDNDLEFTFGYCSRWRMTIGNVTYNGTTEETKSYEKYYKASHPSATYNRKPGINAGGTDNIYYNVWFPGEFYNLIETDTLDGVTVAVGYTVSGSSFMEQSAYSSGYYGTALGSVYNDGVLAAYTENGNKITNGLSGKGEQNIVFQNLLYYKMPEFLNSTTHSRDSVRFTVVGLNAETSKTTDTTGTKEYYAYYGDSNGRLWRSYIGKAAVTFVEGDETTEEDDTATEIVELVDAIPDKKLAAGVHASPSNLGMEEIIFSNTGEGISWAGESIYCAFAEITSIECHDDLIIVTGKPQKVTDDAGNKLNMFGAEYSGFAIGVKDDNGNWTWKIHPMQFVDEKGNDAGGYLKNFTINTAKIIGNYYYAGSDGWFGGINLEVLKNLPNGQAVPIAPYNESKLDNRFLWIDTGGAKIYAVGGYATS